MVFCRIGIFDKRSRLVSAHTGYILTRATHCHSSIVCSFNSDPHLHNCTAQLHNTAQHNTEQHGTLWIANPYQDFQCFVLTTMLVREPYA